MAALLLEAGILLAVVAVGGALAARIGRSVFPAYILTDVVVGPDSPVAARLETVAALAVGYVLVMSVLGTVLMRYSGPLKRAVQRRQTSMG